MKILARAAELCCSRLSAGSTTSRSDRPGPLLEKIGQLLLGTQKSVSRTGERLLELPNDLAEDIPSCPRGVWTFPVIERKSGQPSVEEHFALRYPCQGSDPGNEPRLTLTMRGHPPKSIQVSPYQVHQHGLGQIIQVESEYQGIRFQVPRGGVE
jgi:hypothetical protein